jgi:hypothetical protein
MADRLREWAELNRAVAEMELAPIRAVVAGSDTDDLDELLAAVDDI